MAHARMNIFNKIVLLVILLLIPVILLYGYSNRVSLNVVEKEIRTSTLNQLNFFLHQIDSHIDQLALFPVILSNDPYIRGYMEGRPADSFKSYKEESKIAEKLSLQSVSSSWTNDLTLFVPSDRKAISSNNFISYDGSFLPDADMKNWSYERSPEFDDERQFTRQIAAPITAIRQDQLSIIRISFSDRNIATLLDQFKAGGQGDPFLLSPDDRTILNSTASLRQIEQLVRLLSGDSLPDRGNRIVELNDTRYLVNYTKSASLGWYLVDYVPLGIMLSPITSSRTLFYSSIGLLLLLSLLASFLLYRNVQIPIRKLTQSVHRLKIGDFSTRISYMPRNEFGFLITGFNKMAEQIQNLIQTVYIEKLHAREATLKQLQSQINPHFLYNCLFFIVNSIKLGDTNSPMIMAQNLGDYYRYNTRLERQLVSLREEIDLITKYLEIQNLRTQSIHYEIDIPESMMSLQIPRLLLQPIVENAVIHGLEPLPQDGIIVISGNRDDEECRIQIEDNGVGMPPEKIKALQRELEMPVGEEMGCGLWNVHQRLAYQFGKGSGLEISPSVGRGLCVVAKWRNKD